MTKTILITGSTDGIGKLTALKLANDGHTVILHGRNQEKLHLAIDEVKKSSNNSRVKGFIADFSDLESVNEMAKAITKNISKLDVLINNAGVLKSPHATTKKGLDVRYVVNYFAPYVLTNQLLPLLQQSDDPRIINLSSAAQSPPALDALEGNTTLSEMEAYSQSKLALTMWSFDLAKKQTVSVIAVNPGSLLNTKMVQQAFGGANATADKGADILYRLAVSEEFSTVTGKYFDNDKGEFGQAHPHAYSTQAVNELISATEKIVH